MPKFHDKVLPNLEKICILAITVSPIIYAFVDPEGAKEIMSQHLTYSSGVAGVYVSGIGGAIQDLFRRRN